MVSERYMYQNNHHKAPQFNPLTMSDIEIEFEARSLEKRDLRGVYKVLKHSFLGSEDVDVEDLTLFLLEQEFTQAYTACSVLTLKDQSELNDGILGLATIIPLKQTRVSVMLVRHMSNIAATDGRRQLLSLLSSSDSNVGLIISERLIKFPPYIAEPIYHYLAKDVKKAQNENLPYNFTHYAIISKVMVPSDPEMALIMGSMGDTYLNQEEEFFGPECDFMLDTKMSKSQGDLTETKKIMVFKAEKLDKIVNIIREKLG